MNTTSNKRGLDRVDRVDKVALGGNLKELPVIQDVKILSDLFQSNYIVPYCTSNTTCRLCGAAWKLTKIYRRWEIHYKSRGSAQ